jgi:sensor histidine kinase YesM
VREAQPDGSPPPRLPRPPFPPELFHLGLGILLATVAGRSIAEREAGERREAQLRLLTEKAQALALQSQMQPHALFNALSGLVELAHDDPEATEAALVALCDYLRRLMAHAAQEAAPLRAERELLEDYLRIEQIRLGERLRVAWDWPGWADPVPVPPLLLQPLVENAVLHGIAAEPAGGELRIAAHRSPGQLVLKVENTGRAPEGEREGLGLGHLRERLRLWRGGRGQLELVREGDWTRARLTLPLAD